MSDLKPVLAKLSEGHELSAEDARFAFSHIMEGEATPAQIAAFLMGMRVRGERVTEITAGATVLREKMLRVEAPKGAVDIVGTGGDGAGTYNISTAAALVTAGAGVAVAKHGNRKASSLSGTADALQELGVNLDVAPDVIARSIREAGIGFMFAQAHHPAMRHVGPVRVELGIKTIFNLIGPLSNPAGVTRQIVGVYSRELVRPFAEALRNLGSEKAWIVHGTVPGMGGIDELTTTGISFVAELDQGEIREFEVAPEDVDLPRADIADLKGGDPAHNAQAIRDLLAGAPGPYRNIVLLNAAGALIVAGKASSLEDGVALAAESIDGGAATKVLERLVQQTNNQVPA